VRKAAALLAAATATLLLLGACASGDVEVSDNNATAASLRLPQQIVGLRLVPETIKAATLEKIDRPYIDNLAVFSLRDGKLLKATLQVARFNRLARPDDASFRGEIIGVLGGQRPFEITIGDKTVNATTGTGQSIFSWFGGRGMFVLSVQQDYPFPRTLLRRLVERDLEL
jgi:hypothetical protein